MATGTSKRVLYIRTMIFAVINMLSLASITYSPRLILDYKKLCLETLTQCAYHTFALRNVTRKDLANIVDPLNIQLNEVIVEIFTPQRIVDFSKDLDVFLTSRPQWYVREQPYIGVPTGVVQALVLHSLPTELKSSYDYLSAVSFPRNSSSCSERAFCSNFIDGTWGNGMLNMEVAYGWCSRAVFAPYTSRTGNGDDRVFLADESACPTVINKWECLFLPSTTCTLPDAITNCHNRECLPMDEKVYFNSASAAGVNLKREDMDKLMQNFPSPENNKAVPKAPMAYCTDKESNIISTRSSKWITRDVGSVHGMFALYGVLTRFNTAFRGFVQEVVHDFRTTRTPVFHPNLTCVAIHVRRDDRALPDLDMLEWCKNHTIVNANGEKKHTGLWIDGSNLSDGQWHDMGCGAQLPYGAATLEHFLNASRVLMPHNKNVFMLTDDPKWLKAEIKKYYALRRHQHQHDTMHIFTPNVIRPNHRGGTFNASVDFWASITLARQCQAVVGHRGSAAFEFIYRNLCYFHDNKFVRCPPLFSIGGP